jgi:hypothetical protein
MGHPGQYLLQGRGTTLITLVLLGLKIQQPVRAGQIDQTIPPSADRRAETPITITRRPAEATVRQVRPMATKAAAPIADLRPRTETAPGE